MNDKLTTNSVPALRFSEFNEKWEYLFIKNILDNLIDCEHKTAPYIECSEYLVVRTNNVKNGRLLYDDMKFTTKEGFNEWTKRTVPSYGDIIFSREAPAGESCLVPKNKMISLGQRLVLLKPNLKKIYSSYLLWFLQSNSGQKEIQKFVIGTTVTRINIKDIYHIYCPLPYLPEQQKIASFLTSVDTKIEQLSKKKTLLEQYKKGMMQKLFNQALCFRGEQGNDFPDWEERPLGDFYEFKSTNSLSRDKLNYEFGKVRNIHYGDIHTKFKPNFELLLEDVPFINLDVSLENISSDKFCKEGDLVIADASEDYDDIGKTIELINLNDEKVLAGLHTLLARRSTKDIHIGYGAYVMACTPVRKQIKIIAQGTKVLGISAGRIEKINLPIPSPEEQQKIANFLSALDKKIDLIAAELKQVQTFKKGLLQQMFV